MNRPPINALRPDDLQLLRDMQTFCRANGLDSVDVHRGPLASGDSYMYVDGLGWTYRRYGARTSDGAVIKHPDLPNPEQSFS